MAFLVLVIIQVNFLMEYYHLAIIILVDLQLVTIIQVDLQLVIIIQVDLHLASCSNLHEL